MNKEVIIYATIGVLAAGAGFGGGWLVAKKHFAQIADEEIASVRETYERLKLRKPTLREATENFEEAVNQDVLEKANEIAETSGYVASVAERAARAEARVMPSPEFNVDRGVSFDPDDDPASDDPVVEEEINAFQRYANASGDSVAIIRQADMPYLVSEEDIGDPTFDHHADIKLLWYKEDDPAHEGILADESNQIIDDIDGMIGLESLNHFGRLSDDPDVLYVRNEASGTDYTVTKVRGRYENIVLGVTE